MSSSDSESGSSPAAVDSAPSGFAELVLRLTEATKDIPVSAEENLKTDDEVRRLLGDILDDFDDLRAVLCKEAKTRPSGPDDSRPLAAAAAEEGVRSEFKGQLIPMLRLLASNGVVTDWSGPTRVLAMRCICRAMQCLRARGCLLTLVEDEDKEVLENILHTVLSRDLSASPTVFNAACSVTKETCATMVPDQVMTLGMFQELVDTVSSAQTRALSLNDADAGSRKIVANTFAISAYASVLLCELAHTSAQMRTMLASRHASWLQNTVQLAQRLVDRVRGDALPKQFRPMIAARLADVLGGLCLAFTPDPAAAKAFLAQAATTLQQVASAASNWSSQATSEAATAKQAVAQYVAYIGTEPAEGKAAAEEAEAAAAVAASWLAAAQEKSAYFSRIDAARHTDARQHTTRLIAWAKRAKAEADAWARAADARSATWSTIYSTVSSQYGSSSPAYQHAYSAYNVVRQAASYARQFGSYAVTADAERAAVQTAAGAGLVNVIAAAAAFSDSSASMPPAEQLQACASSLLCVRQMCVIETDGAVARQAHDANLFQLLKFALQTGRKLLAEHREAAAASGPTPGAPDESAARGHTMAGIAALIEAAFAAVPALRAGCAAQGQWGVDNDGELAEELLQVLAHADMQTVLALRALRLLGAFLSRGASPQDTRDRTLHRLRAHTDQCGTVLQRCFASDAPTPLPVRAEAAVLLSLLHDDAGTVLAACGAGIGAALKTLVEELQPLEDAASTRVRSGVLRCMSVVAPFSEPSCPAAVAALCLESTLGTLACLLSERVGLSDEATTWGVLAAGSSEEDASMERVGRDMLAQELLDLDGDSAVEQRAAMLVGAMERTSWLHKTPSRRLTAMLPLLLTAAADCMRHPSADVAAGMARIFCAVEKKRSNVRMHSLLCGPDDVAEGAVALLTALCPPLRRHEAAREAILSLLLRVPWGSIRAGLAKRVLRALKAGEFAQALARCTEDESKATRSRALSLALAVFQHKRSIDAVDGAAEPAIPNSRAFVAVGRDMQRQARAAGEALNNDEAYSGAAAAADDDAAVRRFEEAAAELASDMVAAGIMPVLCTRIQDSAASLADRVTAMRLTYCLLHRCPAGQQQVGLETTTSLAKLVVACFRAMRKAQCAIQFSAAAQQNERSDGGMCSEVQTGMVEAMQALRPCLQRNARAQQAALDAGLLECCAGMWRGLQPALQCPPAVHGELLQLIGSLGSGNRAVADQLTEAGTLSEMLRGVVPVLTVPVRLEVSDAEQTNEQDALDQYISVNVLQALAQLTDASPAAAKALLDGGLRQLVHCALDAGASMDSSARVEVMRLVASVMRSGDEALRAVWRDGFVTAAATEVRRAASYAAVATVLPWSACLMLLLEVLLGRPATSEEEGIVFGTREGAWPAGPPPSSASAEPPNVRNIASAGVVEELLAAALSFSSLDVSKAAAAVLCVAARERAWVLQRLIAQEAHTLLLCARTASSGERVWVTAEAHAQLVLQLCCYSPSRPQLAEHKATVLSWLAAHGAPDAAQLLSELRAPMPDRAC